MGAVLEFPVERLRANLPDPRYYRPPLGWIKRRARRIQRLYGVDRRAAIHDAHVDYVAFTGLRDAHLVALAKEMHR